MLPDDDDAVNDELDRRIERKQKAQERTEKELDLDEPPPKKEKTSKDKDKDEGKDDNAKWKTLHMGIAEKRSLA